MSNSPILSRPGHGLPPTLLPLQADIHTEYASQENNDDAVINTLRGAIAGGVWELDPILESIAEAAQTLTGATGSALALRTKDAVVCRARAGDTAPDLGSQLSETSGISGECLRTGKSLRCDDTQRDYRVNPEVCRLMGLHSMALIPVRARQQVVGVLEVFSTRAYAFGEPEMTLLRRVAELAEAAYLQELTTQAKTEPASAQQTAELTPASATWTHPNEAALRRVGSQVMIEDLRGDRKGRSRIVTAVAILAVLLSGLGWKVLSKPRAEVASSVPTAPAAAVNDVAEGPATIELTGVSSRHVRANTGDSGMSVSIVRSARKQAEPEPEVSDVVKRMVEAAHGENQAPEPHENGGVLISSSLREPEAGPKPEAPPKLEVSADKPAALGSLLTSPGVVPKLDPPVSAGVSGGSIERRIQPVYPSQAMAQGLEGPVVLDAAISEMGTVQEVKLVSGHPVLARAAIDAVRQWRYRPYELNGKAVAAHAQIVVNFKVPTN